MECPLCSSEKVRGTRSQTLVQQVYCEECGQSGTYSEFHLDRELNTGHVTQIEGAAFEARENFDDEQDPTKALAVTVHEVSGGKSACNSWECKFGQWFKLIPEVTVDEAPAASHIRSEVVRLSKSPGNTMFEPHDSRWKQVIERLKRIVSRL